MQKTPTERRTPVKNKKNDYAFTKKIGKATYDVRVHFSKSSKESLSDKLLRLVKNDIAKNGKAS